MWRYVVAVVGLAAVVSLIGGPISHAADGVRDIRAGLPAGFPLANPEMFRSRIEFDGPAQVTQSSMFRVTVTIKNDSSYSLPSEAKLGYRWFRRDGNIVGEGRANITRFVAPHETRTAAMFVAAPDKPGTYALDIDLVWPGAIPGDSEAFGIRGLKDIGPAGPHSELETYQTPSGALVQYDAAGGTWSYPAMNWGTNTPGIGALEKAFPQIFAEAPRTNLETSQVPATRAFPRWFHDMGGISGRRTTRVTS